MPRMVRNNNPAPLLVETEDGRIEEWECSNCGCLEYEATIEGRTMSVRIERGKVLEFIVDEFDLYGEFARCVKCKREVTDEVISYFSHGYNDRIVLKHIATIAPQRK